MQSHLAPPKIVPSDWARVVRSLANAEETGAKAAKAGAEGGDGLSRSRDGIFLLCVGWWVRSGQALIKDGREPLGAVFLGAWGSRQNACHAQETIHALKTPGLQHENTRFCQSQHKHQATAEEADSSQGIPR